MKCEKRMSFLLTCEKKNFKKSFFFSHAKRKVEKKFFSRDAKCEISRPFSFLRDHLGFSICLFRIICSFRNMRIDSSLLRVLNFFNCLMHRLALIDHILDFLKAFRIVLNLKMLFLILIKS